MDKLREMVGNQVHVYTNIKEHIDAELIEVNQDGILARVDFSPEPTAPPRLCFFPWTSVAHVDWPEQGQ
jgi:hypothetical protein